MDACIRENNNANRSRINFYIRKYPLEVQATQPMNYQNGTNTSSLKGSFCEGFMLQSSHSHIKVKTFKIFSKGFNSCTNVLRCIIKETIQPPIIR